MTLLVFKLDEQRYALQLPVVERVVRAAMVTPLPKAPAIILGVLNVHGSIVPVVDVRGRFGLAGRDMTPADSLVLARTRRRTVAFQANAVEGLVERSEQEVATAASVAPGMPYLDGVAKLDDGLVLIRNLSSFLSLDEEREVEDLVAAAPGQSLE